MGLVCNQAWRIEPLIFFDESRSLGRAAVLEDQWFQWQWSHQAYNWHIVSKELLPIVLAMLIWEVELVGAKVVCNCDKTLVG